MYKILIENNNTILYVDNGTQGLNNDYIIGSLLNRQGIVELIQSLPISEYYIDLNGEVMSLSIEQVLYAYDRILNQKDEVKPRRRAK
jgi:hypothetical protein